MRIIPAIDLYKGSCVRLLGGQFNQVTVYDPIPHLLAQDFASQGATWLHVVDLEASRLGYPVEKKAVLSIIKQTPLKIQLGGGIRNLDQARFWLENGIQRVIMGSAAIDQPTMIQKILDDFGPERCVLAVDVVKSLLSSQEQLSKQGDEMHANLKYWYPKTQGWTKEHPQPGIFATLLQDFQSWGGKYLLSTDISRDGALKGPSMELYQSLLDEFPNLQIIASGGIGGLKDLDKLKQLGVYGSVIGKALYEKKLSLPAALELERETPSTSRKTFEGDPSHA
jgi:phosphoribosylformimino-5-aminoimidazole carboxamide ribotide isomerase